MSKANCVNIDNNKENCTCEAFTCERHGVCCECILTSIRSDCLPNCVEAKIKESQKFRSYIMNLVEKAESSG